MPAFTFEKISSPIRSTTAPTAINTNSAPSDYVPEQKPRGVIFQMLDRLAIGRMKRDASDAFTTSPLKPPPPD